MPPEKQIDKIEVVSVSKIFADAIDAVFVDAPHSVAELRQILGRLAAAGDAIRVLDRSDPAEPLPPGVEHAFADLADPGSLAAGVQGCDILVHLASTSVPGTAGADIRADAQANVVGSLALLEAAHGAGVRRVLFLSSGGAVYGRAAAIPTAEDQPLRPIGAYGAAKAAVEAYLGVYAVERGIDVTVLRLSNVYGPGQSPSAARARSPPSPSACSPASPSSSGATAAPCATTCSSRTPSPRSSWPSAGPTKDSPPGTPARARRPPPSTSSPPWSTRRAYGPGSSTVPPGSTTCP